MPITSHEEVYLYARILAAWALRSTHIRSKVHCNGTDVLYAHQQSKTMLALYAFDFALDKALDEDSRWFVDGAPMIGHFHAQQIPSL